MAKYIELESAIQAAKEPTIYDLTDVPEWLSSLPTANVVPVVYGRWLDGRCTNCAYEAPDFISYVGYELDDWEPTPYCHNCGARMDGE